MTGRSLEAERLPPDVDRGDRDPASVTSRSRSRGQSLSASYPATARHSTSATLSVVMLHLTEVLPRVVPGEHASGRQPTRPPAHSSREACQGLMAMNDFVMKKNFSLLISQSRNRSLNSE